MIYNRLYGQHKDKQIKRNEVTALTTAQKKEQDDLKECSFKPVTHTKGG